MTSSADPIGTDRALVVGIGLIGGSVALGLKAAGWHVSGLDTNPATATEALELGVVDEIGDDAAASVIFICVPAADVSHVARATDRTSTWWSPTWQA